MIGNIGEKLHSYLKNILLNTEYILGQGVNGYLGFIEQVWGQPRLFGLRLTYKL